MTQSPTKIHLDVRINGIDYVPTVPSQQPLALQIPGPQRAGKSSSSAIGRPSPTFEELLRKQVIRPGDPLYWYRHVSRDLYIVWITDAWTLKTEDGVEYASPSAAAEGMSGTSVNGLKAWRDCRTGKSLNDLLGRPSSKRP
ncbi:hypothetical protein AB0B28_16430 [Glycomyces sp. NPDC046736]|uniref:restriction system modified-DNA reader domain-containing protein n=1 Tax=Glycomyces sp. NPDC046736 TaxID=3155615 RepID=UPI0033E523B0